jgi:hypothetical protein
VAWQGDDDAMAAFVERHGLSFASANDDAGELFTRFKVPVQPAWAFITPAGEVELHVGALEPDGIDAAFTDLAARS